MAISYTKNNWTDTEKSGTAITAAKLNAYENVIASLVAQVNALSYDSGLKFLAKDKDAENWHVAYRRIGKMVWVQIIDYGIDIGLKSGQSLVLKQVLPSDCRPRIKTYVGCDGIGAKMESGRVIIYPDGTMNLYFSAVPDQYFWVSGVFPV